MKPELSIKLDEELRANLKKEQPKPVVEQSIQGESAEEKWKLISHSHQIADTGDYDGCYEITDGKVSLYTNDDDDEAIQPIINALNDSGCKFYLDDATEFELHLEKQRVKELDLMIVNSPDKAIIAKLEEIHQQYLMYYAAHETKAITLINTQWENYTDKLEQELKELRNQ